MIPGILGHGGRRCTNTSVGPYPRAFVVQDVGTCKKNGGGKVAKRQWWPAKTQQVTNPAISSSCVNYTSLVSCQAPVLRRKFREGQKAWSLQGSPLVQGNSEMSSFPSTKFRLGRISDFNLSFQISKLPLVPSQGQLLPGICQDQKHIQDCMQHLYTATVRLGHSCMMASQATPSPQHSWRNPGHSWLHIIVRKLQGSPSSNEDPHCWELSRHRARVLWSHEELQFKIRDKVFPFVIESKIRHIRSGIFGRTQLQKPGKDWFGKSLSDMTAVTEEGRSKAEICFPTSSYRFDCAVSLLWGAYLDGACLMQGWCTWLSLWHYGKLEVKTQIAEEHFEQEPSHAQV